MAEDYDFIAVMPSGLLDGTTPYWVAAPVEPNRDVTFLSDLLDHHHARIGRDDVRLHASGSGDERGQGLFLAREDPFDRGPRRLREGGVGDPGGFEGLDETRPEVALRESLGRARVDQDDARRMERSD